MTFGRRLRHLRKEKKLSAEELAELANVGQSSVYFWELNRCYPSLYAYAPTVEGVRYHL